MYLHIGGDVLIPVRDIVAVIDYDNVDKSQITDEFIKLVDMEGLIEQTDDEKDPKSFIITNKKVYLSSISSTTLHKRSNSNKFHAK